uniref:Uncharacterized protein n=1 Tax=Ralstonia solanacearum TaxID=305 RepID=A0A0S4VL52_RALSL|nr:protein of unknown function [Ralstonia solanacearum]CUV61560.1 protein of unknown function [Ralstonia solanacearum]
MRSEFRVLVLAYPCDLYERERGGD